MNSTTSPDAGTDNLPTPNLSWDEEQRRTYSPGKSADWTRARRSVDEVPLSACTFAEGEKGNYFVTAPGYPHPVASDYLYVCEGASCRLEKAWQILRPQEAAPWKTVGMLNTLRQAIREWHVQMMPLDLPADGSSKTRINTFLNSARVYDRAHHGEATF